jgi:ketosteroid isomerase-like protein
VSQENVDIVRRLYDALGGPELDKVTDEIWDPEIEWHASELFGVLHGREAVLIQIAEFADPFEDWQVVPEELIDAGDEVVCVTQQRGSGKVSGASMDARYAIVFTIRANTIVRVCEYATRAEALKAVGLED